MSAQKEDHSAVMRVATQALLVLLLFAAATLQARLVLRLNFPGENAGLESESLQALRDLRSGRPLYRDYSKSPYLLRMYMPLFYWLPGIATRAWHTEGAGIFVVGRAYACVSWWGIALFVYALARRHGGTAALIASLFWLAGSVAPEWAVAYRPDAPALLFSLAALWVYRAGNGRLNLFGTLILLVAAFFHKQSAVAALAAIVVNECALRRLRRAMLLGIGWLTVVVAGMFSCQKLTGGTFWMNVAGGLLGFGSPDRPAAVFSAAMLAGAAVFVAAWLACFSGMDRQRSRLLKLYFMAAFAVAALTSLKYGSYTNYYLEPYAAGCVLTAALIAGWQNAAATGIRHWLPLGWAALALASAFNILQTQLAASGAPRLELDNLDPILADLQRLSGPVLIEDPYLALRQSNTPVMIDAAQLAAMQRRGRFDDSELLGQIEGGEFAAIVMRRPLDAPRPWRFSVRWIGAMRGRYFFVKSYPARSDTPEYRCYLPRQDSPPGRATIFSVESDSHF